MIQRRKEKETEKLEKEKKLGNRKYETCLISFIVSD